MRYGGRKGWLPYGESCTCTCNAMLGMDRMIETNDTYLERFREQMSFQRIL